MTTFAALSACTQAPPPERPAGFAALEARAAIEDLLIDYYAQIGTSKHDYSAYFTTDGVLEVNGLRASGRDEIEALYRRAGGGAGEAPPPGADDVPPGTFQMVFSNLKVEVDGNTAFATLLWRSIVSATLIAPPAVTEYGRERSEFVRQDGRWLISRRIVTSEGGMPAGLLESYRNR